MPSLLLLIFPLYLTVTLWMIASPPPKMPKARDVFGFGTMPARDQTGLPDIQRYPARDGEELAVRVYPADAAATLIMLHGSSYHGAGYHGLAKYLANSGAANVVLPNLRGHYLSGPRRGDVDYVAQLEDDIADLITWLRARGTTGPILLGGHSSGGGLAIRFAGGVHRALVDGFVLLSPIIPVSPAMRDPSAGGWNALHTRRMFGLFFLPLPELRALPIIAFNKPVQYRDGTETLSYSMRLNVGYHPRFRYRQDLARLGAKTAFLVGSADQAVDGEKLREIVPNPASVTILPGIDHFGIFTDPVALAAVEVAVRAQLG